MDVTSGLRIRIDNHTDSEASERVFGRFPVRIGRNPLNDLQLEYAFVSQFHAVLDFIDGQLVIQDLGSTNGTLVKNLGRVSPNQPINLAHYGNEFTIHTLDIRVELTTVSADESAASRREPMMVSRFLMAAPPELAALGASMPGTGNHEAQRARFATYRSAWQEFSRELFAWLADVPANKRSDALAQVRAQFPGIENEPDFARFSASASQSVASQAGRVSGVGAAGQLETVAIEGLKELAQRFCPDAGPLETVEQVVRFLERLRAFVDVFLKCYLPLRDGHRQFETDMALRRPSMTPQMAAKPAVETAKSPQELALALLDWRFDDDEGPAVIEGAFADMMVHQVALINGVMHGVKSLLQELSPAQTEHAAQNSGGLGLGPYRYKNLWKQYEQRYSDVADEEKQIFAVLFGKQFAQAYGRFFEASEGDAPRGGVHSFSSVVPSPDAWVRRSGEPVGRK